MEELLFDEQQQTKEKSIRFALTPIHYQIIKQQQTHYSSILIRSLFSVLEFVDIFVFCELKRISHEPE